jgi:hypothetical protein
VSIESGTQTFSGSVVFQTRSEIYLILHDGKICLNVVKATEERSISVQGKMMLF